MYNQSQGNTQYTILEHKWHTKRMAEHKWNTGISQIKHCTWRKKNYNNFLGRKMENAAKIN